MIQQMDSVILALQAAVGARKLYGKDHAAPRRQVALTIDLLGTLYAAQRSLRIVRIENTLLFDDSELPSCARLNDVLIPLLAAHGIEWIEFHPGLTRNELLEFLTQLERPPAVGGQLGTSNLRVGRLGRSSSEISTASAIVAGLDHEEQVTQLQQVWTALRGGTRADHRLSELVESIRLAVAIGSDVCRQLADVKSHDEYTFVHTVNVAILSAALGECVGMRPNQVFDLTMAALLHDVGKQHTPLTILNKPGKLDDAERKRMERHTVDGAAILLARPGVPDFAPIVAFEHHANVDGTGYPNLKRTRRPHLASQIVHVADVFDALRTNRPYRAALDASTVRKMLLEFAGKSFDASLVNLFLERVVKLPPAEDEQDERPPKVA